MKKELNKKAKKGIKTIIYRLYKLCKDNQLKIVSIAVSLILSLMGIVFSIGNDYDWSSILSTEEEYVIDNVKNDSNIDSPLYYLIIDTSGSIKQSYSVELTKNIMEQIEAINMSGYYPHRFNFDIDNSSRTIKYHRLLQAQVMYAIIKLYESKKGKLSVVWFSDNPEILPHKDISEILGLIYNQNFQGRNTNFVKLFTVLKHSIINSIEPNRYKIRNCHIYLFSKNDYDLSNQIGEFEYDMRKHNIVCLRRAKFSQQHRTKSVTHESAKLISRQS